MASNICDIEKLVKLFDSAQNSEQFDDEELAPSKTPVNDVKCSNSTDKKAANPYAKVETPKRKDVPDSEEFFDENPEELEQNCWKTTPKCDISYRQSVSSSDMYLAMGLKNPSTSSCENMVVAIDLPGENRQNIDLKIENDTLTLTSPKFFLKLDLPHPVDPKRGDAQFDKDRERLVITLIMNRELDLVNF
ncbi:unnamed protein product [Ceutorhynchus assimilis]|uniref:PIH1D1/2/3 CS-like domain-containing protein n=1 Tax=Ceutorhynchus assimilis TaxID=467358 RepID=A0A9N9MX29_9CUCU|nr:unnamed protein product [Ceutorhynchus assimilis]